jgi:hypothetical protein
MVGSRRRSLFRDKQERDRRQPGRLRLVQGGRLRLDRDVIAFVENQ